MTQPSCLAWNIAYPAAPGRAEAMGGQRLEAERVAVGERNGQDVVAPPPDMALAHAQLQAPVEHLHHRHRVQLAPIDAADRDGASPPARLDGGVQCVHPVDGHLVGQRRCHRIRQQAHTACAAFPIGEPWASMPTASTTASGPRPAVMSIS